MKRIILTTVFAVLVIAPMCAQTIPDPSRIQTFAQAVAKAEGYYIRGTIPNRYRNPGDLKADCGYRFPGQVGIGKGKHAIFASNAAGWAALEHQVVMLIEGRSKHYNLNMSILQVSKRYAGNWRRWSTNVAHNLGVDPKTKLRDYFLAEVTAPMVLYKYNPESLEALWMASSLRQSLPQRN